MKFYPFYRFTRSNIALLVVLGTFGFLFLLATHEVPKSNESLVSQAQGFVLALAGVVIGYYFGSSKDKQYSGNKTDINQP